VCVYVCACVCVCACASGLTADISYGGKTGGELLLSYGFCPPSDTNPHEAYLLRLGMRADDPLRVSHAPHLLTLFCVAVVVMDVEGGSRCHGSTSSMQLEWLRRSLKCVCRVVVCI